MCGLQRAQESEAGFPREQGALFLGPAQRGAQGHMAHMGSPTKAWGRF